MDVFLFVVIIVALGVGAKTLQSFIGYRTQLKEFEVQNRQRIPSGVQQELATLKQRVEVLEKVVTDQGYQLDQKIRSL